MPLSPGTRIGTYEIVSSLGAGGMGEVYRARDTKLNREVALKVLPPEFARDSDRVARFKREAQTLAALNHPHIAHIHGLEESQDGTFALVMELVEGEDLSRLIAPGIGLPIEQALAIARQIAEALDAAHEQGIVHRDLKPANIKVREDGTVKVLDFGLAKAMDSGTANRDTGAANSPTITSPAMTMHGMILGTAAYMSPEQARGKPVDRRADVWAFGCVLFEMLTGQPAFSGETITDVLSAVVRAEPAWSAVPASTPQRIVKLLKRCLDKDVKRRLRDIGDAIAELEPSAAEPSLPVHAPAQSSSRSLAVAAAMVAVAAVTAVAAIAISRRMQTPPVAHVLKLHLNVDADDGTFREPTISPDGAKVVYAGRSRLWVRSLDQWEPRELAGTEAAVRPFWSPDSNWIGYFRSEALLKVPASGGPVVRVATLPAVQATLGTASGAWADDGTIYLSLASGPPLRVASNGGTPAPFMQLPSDVNDLHHVRMLPGTQAIVASLHRAGGVNAIGVVKDNTLRVVLEVDGVSQPAYAPPGYLVFERRTPNAGLWAVPFSLDTLSVRGDPFLLAEGSEPSVSRDGTLAFVALPENLSRRLAWFSMNGKEGDSLAEPREWVEGVALSKDQRRLLASASDGIWAYDTGTAARSRITTDPTDMTPVWLDRDTIAFVRMVSSTPQIVWKKLDAGGEERVLAQGARFPRVTADGRRLVFNVQEASGAGAPFAWEVAWLDLADPKAIHKLPATHRGARFPSVSPDGTLVAYVSGETGRDEVFLTSLPGGEGKWQLSADGGGWASFDPRGSAVYYRALDGAFMLVPVEGGAAIKIAPAKRLFDWGARWAPFFDIAPDGSRGVAAMPVENVARRASLSIMQNWQLEIAPVK